MAHLNVSPLECVMLFHRIKDRLCGVISVSVTGLYVVAMPPFRYFVNLSDSPGFETDALRGIIQMDDVGFTWNYNFIDSNEDYIHVVDRDGNFCRQESDS